MRYEILVAAAIITIVLVVIFNPFESVGYGTACFKEICFNVSLATTPIQQARGLMSVESLGNSSGMLFVFERGGVYPFWMKDVLIPLDIIWIDSDGKVVFIANDAQQCSSSCPSIDPGIEARYVLEINGGTSKSIGLEVGDTMVISF
jgi:uncharacterized membrane protein (UPF0127 family)